MSGYGPDNLRHPTANPLGLQETGPLARALLIPIVIVLSTVASGCVVPPPLELDTPDAGANYPPKVVGAPDHPFPGPLTIRRGEVEPMFLTLADNDLGDTLYPYLFVDYDRPVALPPFATCPPVPPTEPPSVNRSASCGLSLVCNGIAEGDTELHVLDVFVSDRAIVPEGVPAFRALPPGGEAAIRTWIFQCAPAE